VPVFGLSVQNLQPMIRRLLVSSHATAEGMGSTTVRQPTDRAWKPMERISPVFGCRPPGPSQNRYAADSSLACRNKRKSRKWLITGNCPSARAWNSTW
jgi:hypothetical protein